jgi:hypothetical protein
LPSSADERNCLTPLPRSGVQFVPTNAGHEPFVGKQDGVDRTEKGVAGMPLRRLVFLSGLVLAVVAIGPAAAMGAAKGDVGTDGSSVKRKGTNRVGSAASLTLARAPRGWIFPW